MNADTKASLRAWLLVDGYEAPRVGPLGAPNVVWTRTFMGNRDVLVGIEIVARIDLQGELWLWAGSAAELTVAQGMTGILGLDDTAINQGKDPRPCMGRLGLMAWRAANR